MSNLDEVSVSIGEMRGEIKSLTTTVSNLAKSKSQMESKIFVKLEALASQKDLESVEDDLAVLITAKNKVTGGYTVVVFIAGVAGAVGAWIKGLFG